jgi:tRNA dimethylallyltransferase
VRQTPQRLLLEGQKGLSTLLIAGPTASGKTALALALAKKIGGEIISADSRQVYRGLDAGTAKPKLDAAGRVSGITYHLIDAADPAESFDAGRFVRLALDARQEILARGSRPIVAGGTGLYINALLNGLSPLPQADPKIRERLLLLAEKHGRAWLKEKLSAVDPEAAKKIPDNNIQRMIRALEVYELTGRPISSFWAERPQKGIGADTISFFLDWPTEELRARIGQRAQAMWPQMLKEVRALVPSRYQGAEPGFQSLGYRDAVQCVRGEIDSDEGLARMIQTTCAYAKRQRTWFRNQLDGAVRITGSDVSQMLSQILAHPEIGSLCA